MTVDINRRISEHNQGLVSGFSKKYTVHRLVYYEETQDVQSAIKREKQLKKWKRSWKIRLIESVNPNWDDLHNNFNNVVEKDKTLRKVP